MSVEKKKPVCESEIEKIRQRLRQQLQPHRYLHSLGTAGEAEALARHWRLDENRAYLAGLLHDFTKNYSGEELLRLARAQGLAIDDWTAAHPGILHGPVAALLLSDEWGIEDKEVAEAIRWHTVPQPDMCELAKVVYLADKIEPSRKTWPGLERLRRLAYSDLDAAIAAALAEIADYVTAKGQEICPWTEEIGRAYRNKVQKQDEPAPAGGSSHYGGLPMKEITAEALLNQCVELATAKKAHDVVSLKLAGLTLICDYFLLASASNTRQTQSICDHIGIEMKKAGYPPLHIEGYREGRWILMDFGMVVVHIFLDDEREYYNLERLWGDAERNNY
ncbi:MAG: ribosome silencing factor [Clostridia bacterium]|nr:ribosome silencing factor [Clostridia bacterium]